jgi:hypothetical protein
LSVRTTGAVAAAISHPSPWAAVQGPHVLYKRPGLQHRTHMLRTSPAVSPLGWALHKMARLGRFSCLRCTSSCGPHLNTL